MAERRRLFFTLWPDPRLRAALTRLAGLLVPEQARRLDPGNLHLTLAFLGGVDRSLLPKVLACADRVRAAPFSFTLEQVEHWPHPRILCLTGDAGDSPPGRLAETLRNGLLAEELPCDTRPFRAHLTLARKVRGPLPTRPLEPVLPWRATRFCLVESQTRPEGARYRPLAEWPLATSDPEPPPV